MVNKFIKCEHYPNDFWTSHQEQLERRYSKTIRSVYPDLMTVTVTEDGPNVISTPGGYRIREGGKMESIPVFFSAGFSQGAFIVFNELVHFRPSEFTEAQSQFRALCNACEMLNNITADEYQIYEINRVGKGRG